jgi:bacterioferritin
MASEASSAQLMELLNQAVARELQVSIQYMFQHATISSRGGAVTGKSLAAKQFKFVASEWSIWLPGPTLRKVGIAEMRHAEAIAERVVALGGEPTTEPGPIVLGQTAREMLADDREQERGAIDLYRLIIEVAGKAGDRVTRELFQGILAEEESHFRIFSELLEQG